MYFEPSSKPWGPVDILSWGGAGAEAVAAASQGVSTYSPHLDRDLKELRSSEIPYLERKQAFLGGTAEQLASFLKAADLQVLYLGGRAEPAVRLGRLLGEGRLTAIGLTDFTREQRDDLRATQRLLPLHEVELEVAVLTALAESDFKKIAVSLNLDLFQAAAVPEIDFANHRGVSLREFFSVLGHFPGARLQAFHLWGQGAHMSPTGRTSVLGAETLRDAILTWWGN